MIENMVAVVTSESSKDISKGDCLLIVQMQWQSDLTLLAYVRTAGESTYWIAKKRGNSSTCYTLIKNRQKLVIKIVGPLRF